MTAGIAADVADALLDEFLASAWVQLHTGSPGADGTSNVAANDVRQEATFGSASAGVKTTTADLVWDAVAGSETYRYASVWTDETSGSFLGSSLLDAPEPVTAGDPFKIDAGDVSVSMEQVAA